MKFKLYNPFRAHIVFMNEQYFIRRLSLRMNTEFISRNGWDCRPAAKAFATYMDAHAYYIALTTSKQVLFVGYADNSNYIPTVNEIAHELRKNSNTDYKNGCR